MKPAVLLAPLFVAAVTLIAEDGSASQPPPTVTVRLEEPIYHSSLPPDMTFRLSLDDSHQLFSDITVLAEALRLWDLVAQKTVAIDVTAESPDLTSVRVRPRSALVPGREYGLRLDTTQEIASPYPGAVSTFSCQSRNGELGRFVVGGQPRVWQMMLKGGRTLYLHFSEPVQSASVTRAFSLTNSVTGATIFAEGPVGQGANWEFSLIIDGGSIDATVPHLLRVSKAVVNPIGVHLDGDFSGRGDTDLVRTIPAAELEKFVKGGSLDFHCHNNTNWWDAEAELPVLEPSICLEPLPPAEQSAGCGIGASADHPGAGFVLLIVFALAWAGIRRSMRACGTSYSSRRD